MARRQALSVQLHIDVKGGALAKLAALPDLIPGVIDAIVDETADEVRKRARRNASNGKHKRGTPTPARPGEGPAVISGHLRRNIRVAKTRKGRKRVQVRVYSHATYGRAVEDGHRGTVRVGSHTRRNPRAVTADTRTVQVRAHERVMNTPAYPYLRPAVPWVRANKLDKITKKHVRRALKEAKTRGR